MTRKRRKTRTRQQRKAIRRRLSRAWHRTHYAIAQPDGSFMVGRWADISFFASKLADLAALRGVWIG